MTKIKVAVGLSGGVDSAVSAYLLKKQGFDISGVYLHCFDDDAPGCRGKQDRQDALSVALHLKIPFQVLDFRKQYKASVIAYFKKEYLAGRTPNPDVICNRDIKFGLLLDWAIKIGFDYVATGHYAKLVGRTVKQYDSETVVSKSVNSKPVLQSTVLAAYRSTDYRSTVSLFNRSTEADLPFLVQSKDKHKDQTYFLWAVPRQKFSRLLFPLADFRKQDVRSVAKFAKIPVADKPDSTGICFIGEVRVADFLKRLGVKEKAGEVVIRKKMATMAEMAKNGYNHSNHSNHSNHYQIIGSHRGVWFYTIGQRHGFSVDNWPVIGSQSSVFGSKSAGFQFVGSGQINRQPTNQNLKTENRKLITDKPPLYVIEKDVRRNRLTVGFGAETYREKFVVSNLNWLVDNEFFSQTQNSKLKTQNQVQSSKLEDIFVRIRHGGDLVPCSVIGSPLSVFSSESAGFLPAGRHGQSSGQKPINRELITVFLAAPQRGIAPGQSAVFYDRTGIVLGGGVIQ